MTSVRTRLKRIDRCENCTHFERFYSTSDMGRCCLNPGETRVYISQFCSYFSEYVDWEESEVE